MTSLPERRPIIRGEHVYLRPAEREDIPHVMGLLRDEWLAQPRPRSWELD